MTPRAYRERGFLNHVDTSHARDHAALVNTIAPCVGLYHTSEEDSFKKNDMTYSVTRKRISPQPVLVVRRKVKRSDIAATIAETLPHVFAYAQQHGIALAGLPFTRYIETGPGLVTMEPGMRVASPDTQAQSPRETEVVTAVAAPWESYVTDPADYPDPKDWKTEVFWPLAR